MNVIQYSDEHFSRPGSYSIDMDYMKHQYHILSISSSVQSAIQDLAIKHERDMCTLV
jgi:hypothetical protein